MLNCLNLRIFPNLIIFLFVCKLNERRFGNVFDNAIGHALPMVYFVLFSCFGSIFHAYIDLNFEVIYFLNSVSVPL